MRKLSLIIPIALLKSILTYLIFLIPLFFIGQDTFAQTYGCHVVRGMSDVLYDIPYASGSPNEWITIGVIDTTGTQGGFHYDTGTYGCIQDIGGTCTVYQQYEISYGPPQVIGVRPYKIGTFASIQPSNCPIDDYIPSFFIFTAIIAFFRIKRKALPANK